ncbi:DUF1905 domain-containing protein [Botryobacter ruber]|uniref:DUF1905 domain-containing protein n=1 Tax=Botryobacter ruber TaxID=2171629 RepID=UPI000E0BDE68|nr:YdeI/OmpD-associated family protein [Botryobacter ruber]
MAATAPVTYKTSINRLEHLMGTHYLEVPPEVIQQLGGKLKQRLHCTVNHTLTFQCGLVALGQGAAYISLNNKRMKEAGIKFGDVVHVSLQPDESEYGMEVPEELAELLRQDDEGQRRFRLLTPGKQRYIIQYVASVKSSQLRIDRALLLINNLKTLPVGKESFRQMLGLK